MLVPEACVDSHERQATRHRGMAMLRAQEGGTHCWPSPVHPMLPGELQPPPPLGRESFLSFPGACWLERCH